MKSIKYSFTSKVWKYKGTSGGWHFVTLPKALALKIRKKHSHSEEGWGRLKVTACIGDSRWETAIWYDTKAKSYMLPIKAAIRKSQKISVNNSTNVTIHVPYDKLNKSFKYHALLL